MNQIRDISLHIFDTLKDRILTLEYLPGRPISEAEVCELFSASRTPVRTAMQRLSDLGLVDILPYQQSRVSLIDLTSCRELVYSRTALEEKLLKDFISLDSPMLAEDIEHYIRKQEITIAQESFTPEEFYKLDAEMHSIWFRALDKMGIWEFFQNNIHYTRMRILDITTMKDYRRIVDEHKIMLEYIRERNIDELRILIDSHLGSRMKRLEERIDSEITGYFA